MKRHFSKLSDISFLHFVKLIFRSVLFLAATGLYVFNRIRHTGEPFSNLEEKSWLLGVIWLIFAVEMALRFFPSSMESMGCQKQFRKNYIPTGTPAQKPTVPKSVWLIAGLWIALNAVIGALYFARILDKGILLLISLAFSVCDMICILFFCPFQTWFMKNKCCTGCRIYNWDYAMMFTPLAFIGNFFAGTLFGLALLLLIRWEVTAHLHPERFSETTNACLSCANCREKLCHHKKQLRGFWKKNRHRLPFLKGEK